LPPPDGPRVNHLDKLLGLDKIEGVDEEGLSYIETSKHWAAINSAGRSATPNWSCH